MEEERKECWNGQSELNGSERESERVSDNKVYFFQQPTLPLFYAPGKETKEKWLLRVFPLFFPFSSFPFLLCAEFYFKIYFSIFLLQRTVSEYTFRVECNVRFNVFNFFTSRKTSPKKQYEQYLFIYELSKHCVYTVHTQQERVSTYICICFFVACSIVVTPFFLHLKVLVCVCVCGAVLLLIV